LDQFLNILTHISLQVINISTNVNSNLTEKSFMKILIIISVFLLSSCNAANNYYENLKHTSSLRYLVSDEEKLERYQYTCNKLGLTQESDNWERCLISAKEMDEAAASQRRSSSSEFHKRHAEKARACGMNPANC